MTTLTHTIGPGFGAPSPRSPATGTGLPWLERALFEHVKMPRLQRRLPWHAARGAWFQAAHRSLDLAARFSASELAQPVAIRRVPGLEARSTRYSAAEVLEHLVIVNDRIAEAIAHLRAGMAHAGLTRIEAVRPMGLLANADVLSTFEGSLRLLDLRLARHSADSVLTAPHPWFPRGLTAHQWLILGYVHQRIHELQLKAIARALCVNPPPRVALDW